METILSIGIVVAGGLAYYFFKKQQDKKKGWISAGVAIALFVIFGLFIVEPGNKQEETQAEQSQTETQETQEKSETISSNEDETDIVEDEEDEVDETSAESTEFDEEKDDAPRVLDKFEHEVIENIDTYVNSSGVTWSTDQHTEHFLMDVADITRYTHTELQNGVIFISRNEFADSYGNEDMLNAIILYLSPETITKINFDNEMWGGLPNDMYGVADALWIHSEFQTEDFIGVSGAQDDSIPQTYFNLIGQ